MILAGYLKYSTPPNETGIIWVKAEESEPAFSVTVKNGSGGGDYAEDELLPSADDAPEGQVSRNGAFLHH